MELQPPPSRKVKGKVGRRHRLFYLRQILRLFPSSYKQEKLMGANYSSMVCHWNHAGVFEES